jgi:hypothetical protein
MSNYKPDVMETLSYWSGIAYDNEKKFLSTFGKGDPWMINHVSWNDEYMHFSYVCHCGQHVGDSVELKEWEAFIMTLFNDSKP